MSNTPLVIYHGGCPDGFTCAWIFERFGQPHIGLPEAEYWPAFYDKEPPDVTDRDVFIFDFSYKRPIMEKLANDAASLVCYDHHKSAQKELEGLPYCHFDMERSGAGLVWDEMVEHKEWAPVRNSEQKDQFGMLWIVDPEGKRPSRPMIIAYVEDRDLWKYALDSSREVNAAIYSYPMTFEAWDALAKMSFEDLRARGTGIVDMQGKLARQHVRHATFCTMQGHRVPIVNATVLASEIGQELLSLDGGPHPFSVSYSISDTVKFELRSNDEGIDVSEIAVKYGGGGHRNAAGFHAHLEVLDAILADWDPDLSERKDEAHDE